MTSSEYSVGIWSPSSKVRITNKQNSAQYEIIEGYCSEEEARAAVGNTYRDTYCYRYSGHYTDRKMAIDRMTDDLNAAKKKVEELEFAIKVTKKKVWEKV